MTENVVLLLGAAQGGSGQGGSGASGGNWVQMLPIILIFLVFYFLLIRPQRKKQKETRNMINAVRKGDKITTIGGIRGTIKKATETLIILETDNKGNTLEITRNAIASVNKQDTVEKVEAENSVTEQAKKPEEEKN